MAKTLRSTYELKKLTEFWFDISKLMLASVVLKFFEPKGVRFSASEVIGVAIGLTLVVVCAKVGLVFARRVGDAS